MEWFLDLPRLVPSRVRAAVKSLEIVGQMSDILNIHSVLFASLQHNRCVYDMELPKRVVTLLLNANVLHSHSHRAVIG